MSVPVPAAVHDILTERIAALADQGRPIRGYTVFQTAGLIVAVLSYREFSVARPDQPRYHVIYIDPAVDSTGEAATVYQRVTNTWPF